MIYCCCLFEVVLSHSIIFVHLHDHCTDYFLEKIRPFLSTHRNQFRSKNPLIAINSVLRIHIHPATQPQMSKIGMQIFWTQAQPTSVVGLSLCYSFA